MKEVQSFDGNSEDDKDGEDKEEKDHGTKIRLILVIVMATLRMRRK